MKRLAHARGCSLVAGAPFPRIASGDTESPKTYLHDFEIVQVRSRAPVGGGQDACRGMAGMSAAGSPRPPGWHLGHTMAERACMISKSCKLHLKSPIGWHPGRAMAGRVARFRNHASSRGGGRGPPARWWPGRPRWVSRGPRRPLPTRGSRKSLHDFEIVQASGGVPHRPRACEISETQGVTSAGSPCTYPVNGRFPAGSDVRW